MISQTTEYGLRVIVHLASLRDRPATIRQIAQAARIPEGYLAKVLQSLSRARLVKSQRGLHGGSVLARPPESITIFDVAQALDPLQRIRDCPLNIPSHGPNLCPLHRRLDEAMANVEQAFRQSTIADLLAEDNRSTPLCSAGESATTTTALTINGKRKPRPPQRNVDAE